MGVLNGSISYTLYHVDGDVSEGYEQAFLEKIEEFRFLPLTPDSEDDISMGWVQIGDMLRNDFSAGDVFMGDYLLLSLRVDRWSLPAALLKATIAQRAREYAEQKGKVKLSKLEKEDLRETLRREFKEHMLPAANAIDLVWNIKQGQVRLWSQSGKVKEQFVELFESTFGLRLHEHGPYIAARAASLNDEQLYALADTVNTDFGEMIVNRMS